MILTIPKYLKQTNIADSPVQHAWNDADPQLMYLGDARLAHRIGEISCRGVVALSAGFAEWIAWRLSKHCSAPVLFYEIDAVWAGIVDWKYMHPISPSLHTPLPKDWQGPERGPVCAAFYLLFGIVNNTKRSVRAFLESSYLSQLALHVMPDPKPFKDWRRFVIRRLREMYPCEEGNELGPAISKEALDPDFDYKPDIATELHSKFLQGLDYKQNPFLRSPEEMIQEGFEGIPYAL